MKIQNKSLVGQIFKFIDRILFIEKKTRMTFRDVTFFPTEIHLILFLYKEQDKNVTLMAERLGVTKGAVSQTLGRLEKKGILRRYKNPVLKNELTVKFLPFGTEVAEQCLQVTANMEERFDQHLSTLSDDERMVVERFITHIDTVMHSELGKKG